ncbi:MAG: DUF433 domain-containing protein [Saprospirales bacterium]|nr:DUF433 domain-containing protein [Saprospirales bacterium]
MVFEDSLKIGNGIYTVGEISRILRLPSAKVSAWLKRYWDGKLGEAYSRKYSWKVDDTKAVGFHTLVEFYVMMQFSEAGVKPKQVLKAHLELSFMCKIAFPFAKKEVLEGIQTDGKKIFLKTPEETITLDGTRQLNLEFIEIFFRKLEFGAGQLANSFYPLGKDKSIVVDPKRQFGHPVIGRTNIYPETIFNLHKAGEPSGFIAFTFEISEQEVLDAIEYCNQAA